MTKYSFCNNCGKQGHLYHQCKRPITSIGIIAFRKYNEKREFLMICRKNSLGFVDFMRGKYKLYNPLHLANLINEMTNREKSELLEHDFQTLWTNLWGEYVGVQYRGEENTSKEKFKKIRDGIELKNGRVYNLQSLIEDSTTKWETPEWGFPKGRRNYQENDLSCALREWEEETGYSRQHLDIIHNLIPFEEIFTGSNFKSYKHKYFLGEIHPSVNAYSAFQQSEVSAVRWLSLEDCLRFIRPYNLEKKQLICLINNVIEKYRLIS